MCLVWLFGLRDSLFFFEGCGVSIGIRYEAVACVACGIGLGRDIRSFPEISFDLPSCGYLAVLPNANNMPRADDENLYSPKDCRWLLELQTATVAEKRCNLAACLCTSSIVLIA